MRPDIITTLPDERLLQPREFAANAQPLLRPFGKYARFLVRTGLVVKKRATSDWRVSAPQDLEPIAAWLAEKGPSSAVVMRDGSTRIVAIHRSDDKFDEPAGRLMVLSATTGAGQAFLVQTSDEEKPEEYGEAALELRRAQREARCAPVDVLDLMAVGRTAYASSLDDWRPMPFYPMRSEDRRTADRLESEFDAKVVLARSRSWRNSPGPKFSAKLLADACKHMEDDDQESMVGLSFDGDMGLVAIHEAARGAADHLVVAPRDLLKVPILTEAKLLAIVHNHPSGRTQPSEEDYLMAKKLSVMARCVGVTLLGSFVVGRDGEIEGFALEGTP